MIGGAMTDVKGDRSKAPHAQADPDLYVHVTRRTPEGVYISGATDPRWDNDVLNPAFRSLTADDFEVVALGWNPPTVPPPTNLRVIRSQY